jgi:beta-glucanase (GH16 family)
VAGRWRGEPTTTVVPSTSSSNGRAVRISRPRSPGEVEVNSRNNVSLANGIMSITARGQGLSGWTSDRIETNRQDFQPPAGGKLRVEARLRLPEAPNGQSNGYWPAFWMLAGAYRGNLWNWPTVGEIDIMESVSGLNRTWQTMHCGWLDPAQGPNVCNEKDGVGNGGSGPCGAGDQACTKAFHTYTIDWSRADQSVTWYVDGRQVHRTQRGVNIRADAWDLGFNHGFFIVLNLAIGGEMPANNGVPLNASTTGGGHYDADYVAVYTGAGNAPPPGAPVDPSQPPTSQPPAACATNFALNRPATSSSNESAAYTPNLAVDGNTGTRWSSTFADNQWLQVDLGQSRPITSVGLNWEAAFSSSYQIQTAAAPNGPWTTRATRTAAAGGVERLAVTATARYVRMNGQTRGTPYGHSLWEFQVCG